MSYLSYVEVAENGDLPVVDFGTAKAIEVPAKRPPRTARLRVYFRDNARQGKSSLAAFSVISRLVTLASPGSSLRDSLRESASVGSAQRFFSVSLADVSTSTVTVVAFHSIKGLREKLNSVDDPVLVLEADGPQKGIQKLLDAIRNNVKPEGAQTAEPVPVADDPHQATIDFRDRLLALNWPDGKRVAELAGSNVSTNPAQYATRLRSDGKLLGVWSAAGRMFLHPVFQFDASGNVRSGVAELLKVLPDSDDRGGWKRAFWLYSPHSFLEGRTPAEIFVSDPARVIDVAKREFGGSQDAGW